MITYVIIGCVGALVLLLCLCLAIASFAGENFYQMHEKNNKIQNSRGISTMQYVQAINKTYFENSLKIARCEKYQDHYSQGMVALSNETMYSNSLASFATVSHELGHAKQDQEGDKLKKHLKLRKNGRRLGRLFMPFMLVGAVLGALYAFGVLNHLAVLISAFSCMGLSLLIFFFALYLKYKEIEIEKEASDYAIEFLQEVLTRSEVDECKDFLDSARLTYWAVLFKTMLGWTMLTKKDKMFK